MLNSKQRAYLRGLSNGLEPVFQVGKQELTPQFTEAINENLEKHEMIKIAVLNNCMMEPKEIADILSERTKSQIVQVIGKKIVLYRRKKKPVIELP